MLLIGAVVLTQLDWNRFVLVERTLSEATGRPFAVEGDLSASWQWPQTQDEGWHRWIPGVTLQGTQLVMQDPRFCPPWQDRRAPAHGARRDGTGNAQALALLAREVAIDTLELTGPDVALARLSDGRNNWTFEPRRSPDDISPRWTVNLDRLVVHKGQLAYADA